MVQKLISMLGGDDNNIRESACDTIFTWLKHGEYLRAHRLFLVQWFDCLADDIRAIVSNLQMVQEIVAMLDSGNWTERESALKLLSRFVEHGEFVHR
jgi:hypothetical protein